MGRSWLRKKKRWCRDSNEGPHAHRRVHSKQKPPWISAVSRLLVSWAPCWSYGKIDVRKNTGGGRPNFSVRWFCSTAPGFRNWNFPVHMGILAHPRPCHRLAVPAAPHGPCTQPFALFLPRTDVMRTVYICKIVGRLSYLLRYSLVG